MLIRQTPSKRRLNKDSRLLNYSMKLIMSILTLLLGTYVYDFIYNDEMEEPAAMYQGIDDMIKVKPGETLYAEEVRFPAPEYKRDARGELDEEIFMQTVQLKHHARIDISADIKALPGLHFRSHNHRIVTRIYIGKEECAGDQDAMKTRSSTSHQAQELMINCLYSRILPPGTHEIKIHNQYYHCEAYPRSKVKCILNYYPSVKSSTMATDKQSSANTDSSELVFFDPHRYIREGDLLKYEPDPVPCKIMDT